MFNILWFEDELTWYRMEKLRVEAILKEHILTPQITRKNGDDFELSEICGNSYDLIIMDYKLASESTGDTIVAAIRNNNVLTDVLFYSTEEADMREAIHKADPPIDGIYYTKRDYAVFTEKVGCLINKIVKRSEDLINLRGFVLDDSCDFELRVKELLNIAWHKFSDDEKASLENDANHNIANIEKRQQKTQKKVMKEKPIFTAANNNVHFFSHSDRLYLLNTVIEILQNHYNFEPKSKHYDFKTNYENDISHYRNALGHKNAKESSIELTKGVFIPVDETLHKKMRQNLILYDSLIRDLENFFMEQI